MNTSKLSPRVDLDRFVSIGLAAAVAPLVLAGFVRVLPTLLAAPNPLDFPAYYFAARVVSAGGNPYDEATILASAAEFGVTFVPRYLYPPLFAVALRPLAILDLGTASLVWLLLNLGAALLSILALGRRLAFRPRVTALIVLAFLTLPATYETLLVGRIEIILNALLLAVVLLSDDASPDWRREAVAGIILGIAVTIKVYPAVLGLAFLVHRRFVTLVSAAATTAVLMLAGMVLAGPENTWFWFSSVLPSVSAGTAYPVNQSLWGVAQRLFAAHSFDVPVLDAANYVTANQMPLLDWPLGAAAAPPVVSIALVLASLILMLARHRTSSMASGLSLCVALTLLVSPIVWDSYLIHLSIPLLFVAARHASPRRITVLLAVYLLLAIGRYWRFMLLFAVSPLLMMFGFTAAVLTWILLAWVIMARASKSAAGDSGLGDLAVLPPVSRQSGHASARVVPWSADHCSCDGKLREAWSPGPANCSGSGLGHYSRAILLQ